LRPDALRERAVSASLNPWPGIVERGIASVRQGGLHQYGFFCRLKNIVRKLA
jgi:hypothetical protein